MISLDEAMIAARCQLICQFIEHIEHYALDETEAVAAWKRFEAWLPGELDQLRRKVINGFMH